MNTARTSTAGAEKASVAKAVDMKATAAKESATTVSATVSDKAQAQARTRTPHSLQGAVVSAGADKTITVLIARKIKHPLYKKYIRRSTKVHAHDEDNQCQVGDRVVIQSCRPLSKLKSWRLVEVVGTAA